MQTIQGVVLVQCTTYKKNGYNFCSRGSCFKSLICSRPCLFGLWHSWQFVQLTCTCRINNELQLQLRQMKLLIAAAQRLSPHEKCRFHRSCSPSHLVCHAITISPFLRHSFPRTTFDPTIFNLCVNNNKIVGSDHAQRNALKCNHEGIYSHKHHHNKK